MLTYGEITQNYKGMWCCEVVDENGKTVALLNWTTKAGLKKKLKEMGAK